MAHKGGKILVVEDDKFTGRMMELQFQKNGFDVMIACDGEEALEILGREPFDLVMSDMTMPRISGLELLQRIRERFTKDALPVVLVTATESSHGRSGEAMKLGANDFFTKPEDFNLTLARLTPHVELKRLREARSHDKADDFIYRSGQDGVWNWHIARGTVTFSGSWKTVLGLDPKSEIGQSINFWKERIHPEDLTAVEDAILAHQERRKSCFQADYRIRHESGDYIWVHGFGVALFDKGGQPVRLVGSMSRLNSGHQLHLAFDALPGLIKGVGERLALLEASVGLGERDRELVREGAFLLEEAMHKIRQMEP